MGRMITFSRPDGGECAAYRADAGTPGAPGVVVVQEWWGLNDQIRGVADRLAAAGYDAVVPDLYRGKATLDAAEAAHLMEGLDFVGAARQDLRGAARALKHDHERVAVMGFCMGGALAILAGVHVPELDAVISWYGVPPEHATDARAIKVPVQGHFALEDEYFPLLMVDALEKRLMEAGVEHEFHRYDARHAFGNETGPNYDPDATRRAWERSLSFLDRHLKRAG